MGPDSRYGKKVCIFLPALNEEKAIGGVIDEVPRAKLEERGYEVEILVVDNRSTDGTREVAEKRGVSVITEPRRGKGYAVRTAFKSINSDFVFMLDADLTYPAKYIPQMLELLESGFDVVIGSRLKGRIEDKAMSKMNLVGNHVLTLTAKLLYGTSISDLCTGYWGFHQHVVKGLTLDATGFEIEAKMFAQIARKGHSIAEIPIEYRRTIRPSRLSSLKDGFRIGRVLITERMR
ncbi:glycosyltransferase family 2 protein [Chloroflexota bacterium]